MQPSCLRKQFLKEELPLQEVVDTFCDEPVYTHSNAEEEENFVMQDIDTDPEAIFSSSDNEHGVSFQDEEEEGKSEDSDSDSEETEQSLPGSCKIILADDDIFVHYSIERLIKTNFKQKLTYCQEGLEAIEAIKANMYEKISGGQFRLAILDLNMPGMNGREIAK